MRNNGRTIIILSLFLFFVFVFQLSRMGLLNNEELMRNDEFKQYEVIKNDISDVEKKNKIAILYNEDDVYNQYVFTNIKSLIEKYKIPYDIINFDGLKNIDNNYNLIISIVSDIEDYESFAIMLDYVKAGGNVYLAIPPQESDSFSSVSASLGIIEKTPTINCNSIIDKKGIFGDENFEYKMLSNVDVGYKFRLRSDCEVYFADETNNPLLWKRKIGEGLIYVSNSRFISSYNSRGVLTQILYECISVRSSMIYPAYMISTQLLEEFPSPPLENNSFMLKQAGKEYDDFIKNDFWRMLNKNKKKYGSINTISYFLSYDDKTSGKFQNNFLLDNSFKTYATDILMNGGEIATHGYNLRPLALEGEIENIGWFVPWDNYESIKSSLDLTKEVCHSLFSNYKVRVYVPPQGRISPSVLEKLNEFNSDFNVIVTTYQKRYKDQMSKDYITDENGMFHYSTTSLIEDGLWSTKNSLYSLGISSLSLNINETMRLYDITFSEYEKIYNEMNDLIYNLFPDIRNMKISDASELIKYYEKVDFAFEENDEAISVNINNYFSDFTFILRTKSEITEGDNYSFYKSDGFYVIKPTKPNIIINKKQS